MTGRIVRRQRLRASGTTHHRLGVHLAMATPGGVTLPAGDIPHLTLLDPESSRSAIVTGSVSALLHGLAIGIFALLAWLAPEIAQVIPVQIIELPGSKEEPAPAPRKIVQRRQLPSPSAARVQRTVQPVAVTAVPVSAQSLAMTEIAPTVSPTQLQRTQVVSSRIKALTSASGPRLAAVELGVMQPVDLRPTDLNARVVNSTGPRRIAQRTQVQAGVPQVVAVFQDVGQVEYDAVAELGEIDDVPTNNIMIDTVVSENFKGAGGSGTVVGVARCMESGFVQRYLGAITTRTKSRWAVPDDTPKDTKVILRFEVDASGTATKVDYDRTVNPELGASAVAALRAASPFNQMDDRVRCLAGTRLKATFDTPEL